MPCIATEGDIGDSLVLLGIIAQLPGGPHKLYLRQSRVTKMRTPQDVNRWCGMLKPLAESQPYIDECRPLLPSDNLDWNSGEFRGSGLHSRSANLFTAQLSHLIHTKNIGGGISA